MTTAEGKTEAITKAVNRYLETLSQGRPDDIAALYAEDATVEDPVGGEVHIGRQAIRGFYTRVENVESKTEVLTVRALGNEAAFFWRLIIGGHDHRDHQRDDVRRRGPDRVDEGLLGPGQHHHLLAISARMRAL